MADLELTLATEDYDRVRALHDATVTIPGVRLNHLFLPPMEMFARLFTGHEFDISEMSFGAYLVALSRNQGSDAFPYVGIPVFPSRVFAHSSIYVRSDRIATPADLKGKTVGVPNYQFTRGLCARGALSDEYGITPADLVWRMAGVDQPQDLDYQRITAPPGVDLAPLGPGPGPGAPTTLSAALVNGDIDAMISASTPACFRDRAPNVARLFPDFRTVERGYYEKTGIFPIMHLLAVRQSLVDADPELPGKLVTAFATAKDRVMPHLTELDALAVHLPWLVAEAEDTIALMGDDFWPYGIDANRTALAAQIRWAHEQGLAARRFAVEELFHASTL